MVRAQKVITQAMVTGRRLPPLLSFVLLGVALWLGKSYIEWLGFFFIEEPNEQSLEISYRDWAARAGFYPNDMQRQEILRTELEDRALFKEAVRQQLYRDDPVVYQRLFRNAEFIGIEGDDAEKVRTALSLKLHLTDELIRRHLIEKLKTQARARAHPMSPPSNDLLRARYLAERDRWKLAASIEIEHVFFSADSADLQTRLEAARSKLGTDVPFDGNPYSLGDNFLFGNRLPWMELPKVKDTFGSEFADAVQKLAESESATPGESAWSGPIKSSYGFHFVKIVSYRQPSYRAPGEVEEDLIYEYERELEGEALKTYVSALLAKYEVRRS